VSITDVSLSDLTSHAGTWTLDPEQTTVTFLTKAMWLLPVKGTANATSGAAKVDADGTFEGRLVIDMKSISTGTAKRDQHLQTADFFDSEKYPTMEFELSAVRAQGEALALDGQLRLHGQEQPVSLVARVSVEGERATIVASVDDLDRRRWGIDWAKMGASVHNRVQVTAVLSKDA